VVGTNGMEWNGIKSNLLKTEGLIKASYKLLKRTRMIKATVVTTNVKTWRTID